MGPQSIGLAQKPQHKIGFSYRIQWLSACLLACTKFYLNIIRPTFWHVCGRLVFIQTLFLVSYRPPRMSFNGALDSNSQSYNDALAHDVSAITHKSSIWIKLSFTKNHGLDAAWLWLYIHFYSFFVQSKRHINSFKEGVELTKVYNCYYGMVVMLDIFTVFLELSEELLLRVKFHSVQTYENLYWVDNNSKEKEKGKKREK